MDVNPNDSKSRRNLVSRLFLDHTVLVLALLVAVTTAVAFWYLDNLQDRLVSTLAEQGVRLQSETLEELRALYTSDVVEKVRPHGVQVTHDYKRNDNAIPLPATLTIELGRRIGERSGSGMRVRLFSDYPFPWRKDGGPHDTFEREALSTLRRDPSQPYIRTEIVEGQPTIRYAVADRMRAQCIACHNSHPNSPKTDWKVGDVRGVLEITRPITPFAAAARHDLRQAFGLMLVIALLGAAGVGLVFGKQRRHAKGLADEIAERKRVETDLLASTARFAAMNEASPLGNFVTDEQGRCVYVNHMVQKITGFTADAMSGVSWDSAIHPTDQEQVRAQWQDALARNQTFATECRLSRADGVITWVSCKAAPMRHDARLLGFVGTLEDISARKNVERMKNEFVSTVSHELRTPLTSIMGSLGLLAGGAAGELAGQSKTLVEIARKNSERLVRLINDILDIEKIESGRMQFDLQPRELQPLVEQAITANHGYAEQFGVSFALVDALPDARVRTDADSLMQVMTNLMANAAKFSPAGGTVELRLSRHDDMIRFAVADHGPGIPESFRAKVFEKFSQADSSDTRQKGGTGLGLSISKALVEAMHGRIGFDTQEAVGTTFYVDLPEWREPVEAAPAIVVPPVAAQRPKVLVCEDDRDISSLLCMMLGNAGYQPIPVYDAASAKRMLAQDKFVAMTLDLSLPDFDGRSFLRVLRADPATRSLCVVVVSGHIRARVRPGSSDEFGVEDWIAKPIDQARLLSAVQRGANATASGKSRVLHVEDDPDLQQVMASLCGEVAEFESVNSFRQAAEALANQHYDLVILDIELPDGSGWDLLPLIDQQVPRPPVLVFTGHDLSSEESSRVAATLVKSNVTNPELLDAIRALTGKGH